MNSLVGALIGVELVSDRATGEPAGAHAQFVIDQLCRRGVLVGLTGPNGSPAIPDIFGDELIATLDEALRLAVTTLVHSND